MKSTRSVTACDLHVSKKILEHRKLQGISQEAMAHKLGVSFQQVQKYENGTNRITIGRLVNIAQVLGFGTDVTVFLKGFRT